MIEIAPPAPLPTVPVTFHKFSELPFELRAMIWQCMFPVSAYVHIDPPYTSWLVIACAEEANGRLNARRLYLPSITWQRALIGTLNWRPCGYVRNHEKETLKYYMPLLNCQEGSRPMYFSPSRDVLDLSDQMNSIYYVKEGLSRETKL